MATAMPLAFIQRLDTEKGSLASRQFPYAHQQDIVGQDEEAALIIAAKRGDGHAFEILIGRHRGRVLGIARRFTRIREDAEDIIQQSFQKAFVHLHRFEGKSSFSTWITRIAINEALMLLRRGRRLREVSIDDLSGNEETVVDLEIPDSRSGPESAFLQSERNRILSAAMGKLTSGIRTAIELRELGELSTKETARLMGLSVGAVKGRVFNGRKKLHQALIREAHGHPGNRSCSGAVKRMASHAINSSAGSLISATSRNALGTRGKEVMRGRPVRSRQFNCERE